jgi:hypothetical protein
MSEDKENFIKASSKQDSIKVARNAKGDYSWEVKLYFDNEKEPFDFTIGRMADMTEILQEKY